MRVIASCLVLTLVIGFAGCKLLDELRTFDLNYAVDFTIPSSTIINLPIDIPTPSVTTNSEQRFDDEGIESEWIESVKLTGLTINITSPQGEDFGFLEDIALYMNTNGQPEVLIAQLNPVPESAGNNITLEVTGADLYPYISQSSFSLRTQVTTDEGMTQAVDCTANMVIEVKATIPGS